MSFLSGITSIFTGGQSTLVKWAAILGGVAIVGVGAFFYGMHQGELSAANSVLKSTVKTQTKVVTITKIETKIDTSVVSKLQKQLDSAKGKEVQLQQKIQQLKSAKLTVVNVKNGSCKLSKNWAQIYNESIK